MSPAVGAQSIPPKKSPLVRLARAGVLLACSLVAYWLSSDRELRPTASPPSLDASLVLRDCRLEAAGGFVVGEGRLANPSNRPLRNLAVGLQLVADHDRVAASTSFIVGDLPPGSEAPVRFRVRAAPDVKKTRVTVNYHLGPGLPVEGACPLPEGPESRPTSGPEA